MIGRSAVIPSSALAWATVRGNPSRMYAAGDRVVAGEPVVDEPDHDVVADERARVHDLLRHQPELGALADRAAQHVARRDVRHDVVARHPDALGALAGTLPAEDDEPRSGDHGATFLYLRKPS